ncbi:DNA mismatch repair endonuclease MutL [Psychrobacter sp. DAB_AL62B]|uniref:DNA mismatch repair endonuclease MutL n=1 Tax=Psychrobacter sp. DAB_AL62B TaxID=1028420 RepID=UPI0023817984|nr:DNA mismatch repair endonuclease MutL [Psychrobacter sp. DAB_AL62B]MDE4454145.1 ATPase [Psychrobacter sp. DAB_AL62B]
MPDNHSNTRIKKLSPLLINQLAAGEVVTRPAAVVKELLENAIDASASDIEIHITQGGMGLIEVIDNGIGIHPDDMVMAITRHATSKVADVANLHGITTLGFRGEALAATAAVSRLALTSSHDNSGIGRQLQVAGVLDDTPKLIPVVHHRGTTITVKDLYFNVPARRGNLKSIATEFTHIETIVREVALARADVALTLFHDNKKRLSLSINAISGNDNASRLPLSRLEQATGISLTEQSIEVAVDLSSLMQQSKGSLYNNNVHNGYANNESADTQPSISGWLWPSSDSQHNLPKLIYVNGRLVKEALISNQLRQLTQSAQLAGIGYALYFELPTQWLNINVHPSKQRIKISPLNNIMAHLNHAIHSKLKAVSAKKIASQQCEKVANNKVPNSNISTSKSFDTLFDTSLHQTSSTSHLTQNRQVQAPKQSYQLPDKPAESYIDESVGHRINTLNSPFKETKPLPICLDIITSLNGLAAESSVIKDIEGVKGKTLPWLLFYNQGKFLLINAEDWQSKMSLLFESYLFSGTVFSNPVFKKNNIANSATHINQQLATVSAQMSAQDLLAFIADIEELLTKYAVKAIDNNQLVGLMLSSSAE